MFTIVEDCSPYYIKFRYPGSEKVIDLCNHYLETYKFDHDRFLTFDEETGQKILEETQLLPYLDLMKQRVSIFYTNGGYKSPVHKDGKNHRISINFAVKVLDDKCTTSWYPDVISPGYQPELVDLTEKHKVGGIKAAKKIDSREFDDFDENKHKPVKHMVAQQGDVILFNTDIWHRWVNKSNCHRAMLTLRVNNPGTFYFKDAKKVLFGL